MLSIKINRDIKGGVLFTCIEVVNKIFPFLLLPILSKELSPAAFGIITNYTVLVSILIIFANFGGLPNIIVRHKVDQIGDFDKYLSSSFYISLFNTLLMAILFIPLLTLGVWGEFLSLSPLFVLLAITEAFFDVLISMYVTISRFTKSYNSLIAIRLGQTILGFALSLILVFEFGMQAEGRIYAIFISSLCFGVVAVFAQKYNLIRFRIGQLIPTIRTLYNVCWPLIPHQASKLFRNGSDKVFITTFIGLSTNGLYSIGLQFASVFYMIAESFSLAYLPTLYTHLKEKKTVPRKSVRSFNLLCFGLSIPFYIIAYFSIQFLFDERYQEAKTYLLPMIIAFLMRALNMMQGNQLLYFQRTKDYARITLSTSVFHLIFSFLTIQYIGISGLLWLLVITETMIYLLTQRTLHKLHKNESIY